MTEALDVGREAVARHKWSEAIEALTAADRDGGLDAADLELLGAASWWIGHPDESTEALERAFRAYVAEARPVQAAGVALNLAYGAVRGLNWPVGSGWIAQATRLLKDEPESALHAWLAIFGAVEALMGARISEGIEAADRAIQIGQRQNNPDAMYQGMSFKGIAMVQKGDVEAGMRLIDESAATASSGQLGLRTASDIYCNTIAACRDIGDLGRASRWATEGERFMEREAVGGYPGICRIHRAEMKMLHGLWSEAEQEARLAGEELQRFHLLDGVGLASYQVGEIRLRMGDLDAARTAVEELESIAATYAQPLYEAGALTARGELLLGEARPSEASPVLGQSWRLWQTSDLPLESARARLRYAEALAAEGDAAMARRDLMAARAVFERLGARLDLERVDALLERSGSGPMAGSPAGATRTTDRVTRTFMFTDIVTSTDLVGVIGDEAWSELLRWHDRELRSAFAEHRGDEVTHTGDGFFAAFEQPNDGIECAVEIQRRLARHRREHGFALWVRIGLHCAEVTREGRNFSGGGVHVAARVGAAAAREEILVTRAFLDSAGQVRFQLSEPRLLKLKGVREPVEARAVDWR